jgi:DNA polymerase elongation subunit (family B)
LVWYFDEGPKASLRLISSYEVFEALRRGVAVPFRKRDAEGLRNICELKATDKGGMIFQPEPGVYEKVHQIDFTSLYPSIIVKYNLSPEMVEHPELKGSLATVLSPLLKLRIETKRLKKMQEELFEVLGEARSLEELRWIEAKAQGIYRRYREDLQNADVRELAIHRRVSRLSYSRRCAEASAVQAHLKRGISLAPGMEIGYVVKDAKKWDVDPERDAWEFDDAYYMKLLDKAWAEVAFVFRRA